MMHAAYGMHPILFVLKVLGKAIHVTFSIFFGFPLVPSYCPQQLVFRHATDVLFSG
jgi:hypothetical protein